VEAAWLAQPHPDLAEAYSHVKLGDSARQRLVRMETLASKMPGHIEGALAVARAAIDASEFARARAALAPFIDRPTQRVAVLMADIERTEHGDSGRARAWTLRAVRALHDPAWTADGYVSDRWRPVSPVTGRLDAFQWQTPVASLTSDKSAAIEASPFEEAMLAAAPAKRIETAKGLVEPPPQEETIEATAVPAAQDNVPPAAEVTPAPAPEPAPAAAPLESAAAVSPAPKSEAAPAQAGPLFRPRQDIPKAPPQNIPQVVPIIRPPDDPGIDDEAPADEFSEQIGAPKAQAGGWRGFLSRLGG
jgi:HemY protein